MRQRLSNRCSFVFLQVAGLWLIAGCSMFTSYTKRMGPVTQAVYAGDVDSALKVFPKTGLNSSKDKMCYLLEKGTLEHLAGQYEESNDTFGQANKIFEDNDQRAKVAVGKIAETGGALLINDKAISYEGEPFERINMHTLQAVNYLMLGDKEEARVEIKRAYEQAKTLAETKEKKIGESRAHAQQAGVNQESLISASLKSLFSEAAANDVRKRTVDPYQSAFTSYLSAIVYEMNGGFNDAYIDCVSAHEIAAGAKLPTRELARLASQSGMSDRRKQWEKQFGKTPKRAADSGELVVFFQCGLAAHKEPVQFSIPVPVPDENAKNIATVAINVSYPRYASSPCQAAGLEVSVKGHDTCCTEVLTNLDSIALQNFYDHLPSLLLRLTVRATLKATAGYSMRGKLGSIPNQNVSNSLPSMGVLGSIPNLDTSSSLSSAAFAFTEQADLRSWLLAPATLQCTRCSLPEGEQTLDLTLKSCAGETLGTRSIKVKIERGKFTIVNLRAVNDFVGQIQVSKPL